MKKVYLTFDIETIVSGISKSTNYLAGVYLSSMFIAEELRKRNLKATFFVSISSKQVNIDQAEYTEFVEWLVISLKAYDNIKIEPHLHALNLPVSFDTSVSDAFNAYDYKQQIELLKYSKSFFSDLGIEVAAFRPGGFSVNNDYYKSLESAGFKYSSILNKTAEVNVDLITGQTVNNAPYTVMNELKEYPVTSVRVKSIKGKEEILNLSPDFFTLKSVELHLKKLEYINVNFHSFSIYLNRLIRENHDQLIWKNLKFIFLENILNRLLNYISLDTINKNTVFSNELLNWLDYFDRNEFETNFIGE